jgi:hypothetical protein
MTISRLSKRPESDYVRVDILRLGRALSAVSSVARLLKRHHRLTSSRPTRSSGVVVSWDRGSGYGYSASIPSGRNHLAVQSATGLARAYSMGRSSFATIAQGFQQRVNRLATHTGRFRYLGLRVMLRRLSDRLSVGTLRVCTRSGGSRH